MAQGIVERVAFEPLGVSVLEVLEGAAPVARVPGLEGGERLPKQASMCAVHEVVGNSCVAPLGPPGHDLCQRVRCQQAAPPVVTLDQARKGDGEGVAREDRSLVCGDALPSWVSPCGPNWIPSKPRFRTNRKRLRAASERGAPRPVSSSSVPGRARVLDSQDQVPDVEALERLSDAAPVRLVADHDRPS